MKERNKEELIMKSKAKLTRLCSILLVLVMLVGLLPTTALAAEATATADFDADPVSALALLNAAKTPGAEDSTWDSDTKTLTLNDVNFTTTASTALQLPGGATIVLNGENTITSTYSDWGDCYGIYGVGSLTIQGTGTLDVTSGTPSNLSFGIHAQGSVTINSGAVTATGGVAGNQSFGIRALNGDLTINGGTVTATGGTAKQSSGLWVADYSLVISGGIVVATGGNVTNGTSSGIYAKNVVIQKTASRIPQVTTRGGTATANGGYAYSRGIYIVNGGSLTISGGALIADAGYALSEAPATLPDAYRWRILDGGSFAESTESAYSWSSYHDYVEIQDTTPAYTVSFDANSGSGTMADDPGVYGSYTLPENRFTAPAGYKFKEWAIGSASGVKKQTGEQITITGDTVIYAIWEPIPQYNVVITAGNGMTTGGIADQTVYENTAITDVIYTAADGYYFPTDYSVPAQSGISVTRNSFTQITVSGTPTAAVNLTLTDATAKTKEAMPSAAFTAESENGGKLTGVDSTMKYSVDGGSEWLDITGDNMAITSVTTTNGVQVKKPSSDANTKLDSDAKIISVTEAEAPTTVTTVPCTNDSNNDGKLRNVTASMEYKKSDAPSWADCGGTEVGGLVNGTYYVRVKAAGTVLASDYQEVQIAAYVPGALGGTVSISGTAKYNETLTAVTSAITGNTGTLSYQWKRGNTDIGTNSSTYTLVEEDIGSKITVTVSSSEETGTITSAATATVEKADGPAAPSVTPVACTNGSNNDGKITGVTTAMEYSTTSDFSSKTACTGTEITDLTNGTYYVRVAETATHKAGAAASVNVLAYSAEPTYSIDLDVNSVYSFDAVTVGYAPITVKTVTVSNTGTAATGDLTVALSGRNASSFQLNKTSISSLAASGSDTFTVVPKTGLSADTYTATVTVSGGNSISASFDVRFTVNPAASTYSIDLDVSSVYSFDAVTVGYAPIVAKTVTVSNTGDAATGDLTVALSGSNASSFELNKTSIADIPVSGSDTFTVVPKAGLSAGTYTATVTVSGDNSISASFNVSFTVNPDATTYSIDLDVNSVYRFDTVTVGYAPIVAKTVTVSNTGTAATGALTVALSGRNANSFELNKTSIADIAVSGSDTFTIAPKTGLSAGTYTATVTVSGDNSISASFNVRFTVNSAGGSGSSSSGGGSSSTPTYKVESEISKDADGSVSFSKSSAKKGDAVTITVTPDRYYKVDGVVVKDKNGKEIAVTDNGDGTFTFKMPDSKVTVEPVFSWDNPFGDVAETAYYAPAVEWALKNDVTGGTTTATFSPDAGCTRAQIVTFLWRAAGCPEPAGANSFTDVSADAYYAKAVVWAAEQGITGGTGDGKFSPDAVCTRSQSMTFLYRTTGSPEVYDNASFSDVESNAYYAAAVAWAEQNDITGGIGGGLFGSANECTRAQIVAFLYRFFVK